MLRGSKTDRKRSAGAINSAAPILVSLLAAASGCFKINEMIYQNTDDAGPDGQPPADSECNAGEYLKCIDGELNRFDSCGKPSLVQNCMDKQLCRDLEDGKAACCTLDAIRQCSDDGDVHSFDSCGFEGDLVEDCPDLKGTCVNSSTTAAECGCLGHWDPAADCASCLNEWTTSDCGLCQIGYVGSSCSDCGVDYEKKGSVCVFAPGCGADFGWLSNGDLPEIAHSGADFSIADSDSEPTVLDKIANLEWRRCLVGEFWFDNRCEGTPAKGLIWSELSGLCQGEYAGDSDWRIPEATEVISLIDFSAALPPMIDTDAFPSLRPTGMDELSIATSTERTSDQKYWKYSLNENRLKTDDAIDAGALCVRNVEPLSPPPERFRVGEDDGSTILDAWSGLEWKRCAAGQTWSQPDNDCVGSAVPTSWDSAEEKCGGGWRVPSIRELLTIVNYCSAETSAYQDPFPGILTERYWSSTAVAGDTDAYWTVDIGTGEFLTSSGSTQYLVICAR